MLERNAGLNAGFDLEAELARQLCPVAAPDSLWRAIHEQRRPLRVRPNPWTAWSIAAAALLVLLAGLVWRIGATRDPSADLEALAEQELRGMETASPRIDMRSTDSGEIQRWVKANTGLDVRLTARTASGNEAIRLIGARLIRFEKFPVAVIGYRAGDSYAAMLVTGTRAGSRGNSRTGHSRVRTRSAGNIQLYSWSLDADDYAMAFGGTARTAQPCLLCHAGTPALMVLR